MYLKSSIYQDLFPLRCVAINFLKVKRHFSGNIFLDGLVIVVFLYENKWTIIPFQPDNHLVAQLLTSSYLNSAFVFFSQKIFRRKKFFLTVFLIYFFQNGLLVDICQCLGFFETFSLVLCRQIIFFLFLLLRTFVMTTKKWAWWGIPKL